MLNTNNQQFVFLSPGSFSPLASGMNIHPHPSIY